MALLQWELRQLAERVYGEADIATTPTVLLALNW